MEKEHSSLPPSCSAPTVFASVGSVLEASKPHGPFSSPPPLLVTAASSQPQPGLASPPANSAARPVTATKTAGDHVITVVLRGEGKPKAFIEMFGEESKRPPSDGGGGGGGGKKVATSKVVSTKSQAVKGGVESGSAPTRTSQRQIKRPKTDDELIDFEASSRSKKHRPGGAASKSSVVRCGRRG